MRRKFLTFLVILVLLVAQLSVLQFIPKVYAASFGNEHNGANIQTQGSNYMVGSVFTAPPGVSVAISFTFDCYTALAERLVKAVLVFHDNLTIVSNGIGSVVAIGSQAVWRTSTFSVSPVLVASTEYVLMLVLYGSQIIILYDNGATNQGHRDTTNSYASPANPTDAAHNDYMYSIYCTYTIAADTTPPTYSNVGTNTTKVGRPCLFFAKWTDETGLAITGGYIFGTNNTGTWANETWVAFTANPDWSNVTKTLNSTIGVRVEWCIWANDTSNNWNNITIQYLITVTAEIPPTSVHTCPLDETTFVLAYHDEDNDDFSFQIWDTNGTQILAETDIDTTSGGSIYYTSIGVSAFNSTTFVIGWHDNAEEDTTFAVYNITGALLSGPTDADTFTSSSYCVQVSCLNSTHFVIAWFDLEGGYIYFSVYTSSSILATGPISLGDADGSFSVSISAFNSTTFVIGYYNDTDYDATFTVYNSAGVLLAGPIDADTDINYSLSVSVSTLNSTYFVIGWYDCTDQDATFAVYDSGGNLKTGPTDADTTVGYSRSVQVSALNSTAFVISWYDQIDFDLSFATYLTDGTFIASNDVESWSTVENTPFKYQSPCSKETSNNITIYNGNWIIAYANATTLPVWKAYKSDGTTWDGTIPSAKAWYDVLAWTASLVTKTWSSGISWTASLVTRIWSSGTPLSLNLLARQNITVASWLFDLGTSIWKDIATWGANLAAMMWNDVAIWSFTLVTKTFNDVAIWFIHLETISWHAVVSWIISIIGHSPAQDLAAAIILLFILVPALLIILIIKRRR